MLASLVLCDQVANLRNFGGDVVCGSNKMSLRKERELSAYLADSQGHSYCNSFFRMNQQPFLAERKTV